MAEEELTVEQRIAALRERQAARRKASGISEEIPETPAVDPEQVAFEEKEAGRNPVLRKAMELGRGVYRGIENTAVGMTDLVGDAAEAVGLPRGPFADKENVESLAPHSSGSRTERVGEFLGDMVFPGGGMGKTVATTAAKNFLPNAIYAAATSDDEGAGRLADAVQGGAWGAGGAGALHTLGHGFGKVSPEAARLDEYVTQKLGDSRVSDQLPLAQRVGGKNQDWGSRVLADRARKFNTGRQGVIAKDKAQRYNDDMYRIKQQEAFSDVPKAQAKAENMFQSTRDPKKAFEAGAEEIKDAKRVTGFDDIAKERIEANRNDYLAQRAADKKELKAAFSKRNKDKSAQEAYEATRDRINAHWADKENEAWYESKGMMRTSNKLPQSEDITLKHRLKKNERVAAEQKAFNEEMARFDAETSNMRAEYDQGIRKIREKARRVESPRNMERRHTLNKSITATTDKGSVSGRYDPSAYGDVDTAEIMSPLAIKQGDFKLRDWKEPPGWGTILGEGGLGAAAMTSGNPLAIGAGAGAVLKSAVDMGRRGKASVLRKAIARDEFVKQTRHLDPIKRRAVADILAGDAGYQKKYKDLLNQNIPAQIAEEWATKGLPKGLANQAEDEGE